MLVKYRKLSTILEITQHARFFQWTVAIIVQCNMYTFPFSKLDICNTGTVKMAVMSADERRAYSLEKNYHNGFLNRNSVDFHTDFKFWSFCGS
jgi:hypothetical protein